MVSSSLIQLFAKGPIDKVMYGNPQVTFFKCVYKRPTNFATQYVYKNFSGSVEWGSLLSTKIPKEGDLLGGVYIRIKLDDLKRKYLYFLAGNSTGAQSLDGPGFKLGDNLDNNAEIQAKLEELGGSIGFENPIPGLHPNNAAVSYTYEPQFTSFVNGLGSIIIEEISLYSGSYLLETIPGEWIFFDNELHNNTNSKDMFYESVYYNKDEFEIGATNTDNIDLMIPIPFFFTKDSGLNLPLIAMHNDMEIRVKLRPFEECLIRRYQLETDPYQAPGVNGYFWVTSTNNADENETPPLFEGLNGPRSYNPVSSGTKYGEVVESNINTVDIIYKYYHLDESQKIMFLSRKNTYIVPTIHELSATNFSYTENTTQFIPLELRNPVRYIVFVLQRKDNVDDRDYFNFTTNHEIKTSTTAVLNLFDNKNYILDEFNLSAENNDILDSIPSKILNNIEFYTKFRNNSNALIYVYSFAMYPNEINPSGSLNFSQIKDQFMKLKLVNPNLFENSEILFRCYYSSYNVLTIDEGLVGFRFY